MSCGVTTTIPHASLRYDFEIVFPETIYSSFEIYSVYKGFEIKSLPYICATAHSVHLKSVIYKSAICNQLICNQKSVVKFGKWIGGSLGWVLGGPMGGVLGFVFGALLDDAKFTVTTGSNFSNEKMRYNSATAQGDFAVSLLVLSAAVMKSDGKVLKSELDYVKGFLLSNFGEEPTQKLLPVLKELLEREIPLQEVCIQIRQYMPEAQRLQLLHYLFGISKADGDVSQKEVALIGTIATYLNIDKPDFESVRAMYWRDVDNDYKILEITTEVSDDEVKKAYRKMAVKYHPDKVIDLGEMAQKNAKEKFQIVQEAFENIKKKRGMV